LHRDVVEVALKRERAALGRLERRHEAELGRVHVAMHVAMGDWVRLVVLTREAEELREEVCRPRDIKAELRGCEAAVAGPFWGCGRGVPVRLLWVAGVWAVWGHAAWCAAPTGHSGHPA